MDVSNYNDSDTQLEWGQSKGNGKGSMLAATVDSEQLVQIAMGGIQNRLVYSFHKCVN